jgi:hypothetical protein
MQSYCCLQVVGSESEIGGPSYMVNMEGLITLLQRRTIFSIASERFGFVSARIVGTCDMSCWCLRLFSAGMKTSVLWALFSWVVCGRVGFGAHMVWLHSYVRAEALCPL